jgi:leucyl aminopeptidase
MPLKIDLSCSSALETTDLDVVVIPVTSAEGALRATPASAADLLGAELDAAALRRRGFEAARGSTQVFSAGPSEPTILLVGLGPESEVGHEAWRRAAAATVRAAEGLRAGLVVSDEPGALEAATVGGLLASYRFELSATRSTSERGSLLLACESSDGASSGRAIAEAVAAARDLVNTTPSELTPTRLAEEAATMLAGAEGVSLEIWDEARIAQERLGGLLGVAAGSHEAPRLVRATYHPDGVPSGHVVLVGKGITFDSGGLSLKTATGMTTMKTDMTGSAVVLAALTALRALGVRATVSVIAPMAENMPGGAAMKPGDVLRPRSGPSVEVLNTDAEGRLVLADGLSLAVEEDPDLIIDVATLTGAAVVALGRGVGALLSNDDDAAAAVLAAGVRAGEQLWRLPLVEDYESHIASEVADIKNTGATGEAGTISAGLFLQRFVDGRPWVHLDIAGPARSEKASGYVAKGGTAFGLMTLLSFLRALG